MNTQSSHDGGIPTHFVVFGATGDLMAKKIVPSLFSLQERKALPKDFRIIGVSRRDWNDEDLTRHIEAILSVKVPDAPRASVEEFLGRVTYHKLTFDDLEDYRALAERIQKGDDARGMCSNKLFYLSVPPQFYDLIFTNFKKAGLNRECAQDAREGDTAMEGWTRIVVEKPFGSNERTAKALDARLAQIFREDQIYRIDHYLAKETFQNILAFRFYNNLFEKNWGKELIEKIYIRELENIGVEDRGAFYDDVGALRDVGQNHLLQMLALTTMDRPRDWNAESIRARRAETIGMLRTPTRAEIKKSTFRAQYDGYHTIKGVRADSRTETYFRVRGYLDHPSWEGVPIIMEAGKRLMTPEEKAAHKEITEIEVVFRHPEPCLCPPAAEGEERVHYRDRIVFHQDPFEGITIKFWAKKPGFAMTAEERTFEFMHQHDARVGQYTEEYAKLLLDCIKGDQSLFVSSGEIVNMWRFIDPIVDAWAAGAVPLHHYAPDSRAIAAEAAVIDETPHGAHPGSAGKATKGERPALPKVLGIYGLGKMGANVARQLHEKGWTVVASNRSQDPVEEIAREGIQTAPTLGAMIDALPKSSPRVLWLMITAGKANDELLFGKNGKGGPESIVHHLKRGDIVIDAANAYYEDTVRRAKLLKKKGITLVDVGFSGGPGGARHGGSLMIGGEKKAYDYLEPLFRDLSVADGYAHFGDAGYGHFVKMVHNGIEYGMMQAIAEGFAIMKKSKFALDLEKVTRVYNHGSVIESHLVQWLEEAYGIYGQDLKGISGSVNYTGEGEWTVKTGKKLKVPTPVIEDSFKFRVRSKRAPSYAGKVLSALRNRFGGHSIEGRK
jgi:glucose-6-phosphate 1-dehydrogenase